MMTGVSPLEHGVLDFVQFDPQTGAKEPITSSVRRAPAIWNMASSAGRKSAVMRDERAKASAAPPLRASV